MKKYIITESQFTEIINRVATEIKTINEDKKELNTKSDKKETEKEKK